MALRVQGAQLVISCTSIPLPEPEPPPSLPYLPFRLAFSTGCTGLSEKKAKREINFARNCRVPNSPSCSAGRNRIGVAGGKSHPSSSTFGVGGVVGSARF